MITEGTNRYRVSSKMTIVKIVIVIILSVIVFEAVKEVINHSFGIGLLPLSFAAIVLVAIYFYINNVKQIDYDDIKLVLYIVDRKKGTEIEVPVEHIDEIRLSAIGLRGNKSYVIVYRDLNNEQQSVRLFPIMFDRFVDTIKTDTQLKNPGVVIRNWTFGWK